MTVNSYFNNGQGVGTESEQNLAEDNIIELIQMSGHECQYIPRSMFSEDAFYHEAPNDKFENAYTVEMYVNSVSDFGGQGDFMSKFGLQVEDQVEFLVSRKRFLAETSIVNPSEGDLIYFPLSKHLFEIDFVEDEPGNIGSINQFYSLGKLYTFLLKCTLFSFSYEQFDTGIDIIDTQFDADNYDVKQDDNELINEEARDNALDFSENNPFGTTTYED